ncbi:MAG: serine protease [Cyanobacteria bacterium J06632_3]
MFSRVASSTLLPALAFVGISLPSAVQADNIIKTGPEVNAISQATTVLIVGLHSNGRASSNGSGSIISKTGSECVALTNRHVMDKDPADWTYSVRTDDNVYHAVNNIRLFPEEDLAIVTFECQQNYETVQIATYLLSPGQDIYVSGWPGDSGPSNTYIRHFTSGAISTILDVPYDGYQVGYTNVTNSGMSGGQVLDEAGRLVAIHGLGSLEDPRVIAQRLDIDLDSARVLADNTGFNYGIPVTTFLARASQAGFNYPFDVVYSSPQSPANGSTASSGDYTYQPSSSDQVSSEDVFNNINRTLDTIDRGANTFCRFLGC